MSFGIGAFPFGFISSTFNLGDNRPTAGGENCFNSLFLVFKENN